SPLRSHAPLHSHTYTLSLHDALPIYLVIIGSPSGLHATQGIAAARQGLHVLTEKPIEISTARADILIEAAKQSKVHLGVIFQDRSEEHTSELQSPYDLVCRLLLEK